MNTGRGKRNVKYPLGFEEGVFVAILRAAGRLERQAAGMLEQYGLTPTQYNALRILHGGGPGGLACSEIADRMISHDPDITRLLDRLKRRGLISRRRGPRDRRVVKTFITPAGLKLLAAMNRPIEKFHRRALRHVEQKSLRGLIEVLARISETPGSVS